jgi:hypothetical protein
MPWTSMIMTHDCRKFGRFEKNVVHFVVDGDG